MPRLGFEPTNSVFKQAKTFHALDRAVVVNDSLFDRIQIFPSATVHSPQKDLLRLMQRPLRFNFPEMFELCMRGAAPEATESTMT
jgi:hypothetical protein